MALLATEGGHRGSSLIGHGRRFVRLEEVAPRVQLADWSPTSAYLQSVKNSS